MVEQRPYSIGTCHVCKKPLIVSQDMEVTKHHLLIHTECCGDETIINNKSIREDTIVNRRLEALENMCHVVDILQDVVTENRKKIEELEKQPNTVQRGKI